MKFFEYQFNPRARDDIFVETFCFENKNKAWVLGVLKIPMVSPRNKEVISRLFSLFIDQDHPNLVSLSEAINLFFKKEAAQKTFINPEIALVWIEKDLKFEVCKTGKAAVILQRSQQLFDLTSEFQNSKGERLFIESLSGVLLPQDRLFILTEGLISVFEKIYIFQNLCQIKKPRYIKKIFKYKKKELKQIFGACVIVQVKRSRLPFLRTGFASFLSPLKNIKIKKPIFYVAAFIIVLFLGYLLFNFGE